MCPVRRYERPTTLSEAWRLVGDGGRAVGGGTDLAAARPGVDVLVDLAGLGWRRLVVEDDGTVAVGAMCTLTDLLEHAVSATFAAGVLRSVLVAVGSPLHRNAATIGGHLARSRLSDLVPVLLALDAEVEVHDGATRRLTLAEYESDGWPRRTHLVVGLRLPGAVAGAGAAFEKFARSGFDHALCNVACRLDVDGGTVTGARVLVGQPTAVATRMGAAEELLVGHPPGDASFAAAADAVARTLDTADDWILSAGYRRHLAGILTRRCLDAAHTPGEVHR